MKLSIQPKPYKNEALSSWIIRAALANGCDPRSFAYAIWREHHFWTRDIDRFLPSSKIHVLKNITSLTYDEIKEMTVEPIIEKIISKTNINPKKSWYFVVSTGVRGTSKINGTFFCPDCLNQQRHYLKKEFKLAWNIACPIHKKLLVQSCPMCNTNFSPHKTDCMTGKNYLCSNCGFDLRKTETIVPNNEALIFQEMLNDVLFNKTAIPFSLAKQTVQELFCTIRILISFIMALFRINKDTDFLKVFEITLPQRFSNIQLSKSFENMSIENREFMLFILSNIFRFNLDAIKHKFETLNVTYKLLAEQISLKSKTIDFLCENLKANHIRTVKSVIKKEIRPLSFNEAKNRMIELKKFL